MQPINFIRQKFKNISQYPAKFGVFKGFKIWYLFKFKQNIAKIKIDMLRHPVTVRLATTDKFIFDQIFFREDYNINIDFTPKRIVDVGANVGYSAVYFANKFPNAKIVAVEPHPVNFQLLIENTIPYKTIEVINAALWHKNQPLEIIDQGRGEWGFLISEVESDKGEYIRAVTVTDIMNDSQFEKIDILKIDIEGTEKEVFSENYEYWLPKTRLLIVELHDDIKEGCSKAFYAALSNYNFKIHEEGENLFCFNQEF